MNDTYFVDGVDDQVRALTGLWADIRRQLSDIWRPSLRGIFPFGRIRCYLASPDKWTIDGVSSRVFRLTCMQDLIRGRLHDSWAAAIRRDTYPWTTLHLFRTSLGGWEVSGVAQQVLRLRRVRQEVAL